MRRTVIVGAGHIAKQHIACLKEIQDAEIVGLCDLSRVMAEATAEQFGIQGIYFDFERMLDDTHPDIVHIATPAPTHYDMAMKALDHGAHVLIEKPICLDYQNIPRLIAVAEEKQLHLVEDYNYLYNTTIQDIIRLIAKGELGEVVHLDVSICLNILGQGSRFADRNVPHPSLSMRGGAVSDFITHLSYLVHAFLGAHQTVQTQWVKRDRHNPLPHDEFRAMIRAGSKTANILWSANSQPDAFWISVYGTKMRIEAHLFEPRMSCEVFRGGGPLQPLQTCFGVAKDELRSGLRSLTRKLRGGPGAYEGLWCLLNKFYHAVGSSGPMPVSHGQILEVNSLVKDALAGYEVQ